LTAAGVTHLSFLERNTMSNSDRPYEPLTADNAALVLVDHQIGLMSGVRDYSIAELKHNVMRKYLYPNLLIIISCVSWCYSAFCHWQTLRSRDKSDAIRMLLLRECCKTILARRFVGGMPSGQALMWYHTSIDRL
jgi:hypothetical protein